MVVINRWDIEAPIDLTPELLDKILTAYEYVLSGGLDFEGGTFTEPDPVVFDFGTFADPDLIIELGGFS